MQGKILNLLLLWSGKIPQNSDEKLKSKLEKIDAESVSALEKLPLKNPNIALILCIFLGAFGAEDFYRNRHKIGTFKLIFTAIIWSILCVWFVMVEELDYPLYAKDLILGIAIFALWAIAAIIWVAINLLKVSDSVKNDNLESIEKYLSIATRIL